MTALRRVHSSVDLRGLLTWDNKDLRVWLSAFAFDDGPAADVRTLRSKLLDLVLAGTRYLPMGEPCEGWTDADGCPGHDVPDPVVVGSSR